MKKNKFMSALGIVFAFALSFSLAGCGPAAQDEPAQTQQQTAQMQNLEGQTLRIYCGYGMKKPFSEIADNFCKQTGCKIDLSFGNGAQIQSQIIETGEGDFFIAGARSEIKKLESKELTGNITDLARHIPVVCVPVGNPGNIQSLSDLGNPGLRLVFGDAEATPVGKIANKILKDNSINQENLDINRGMSTPQMIEAIKANEADATVVWKENAENQEGVEILNLDGMDKYIKTVPVVELTCSSNPKAAEEFLKYLNSKEAKDIWARYGYEPIEQ